MQLVDLLPYAVFATSIATAYFAWCQKEISRAKLKLDLYNRRFKVYESVVEYYLSIYDKTDKTEKEVNKNFVVAFRESRFLFKSDDGIYSDIEKFKNIVSAGNEIEKENILISLENKLAKYLNFDEIGGWKNKAEDFYNKQINN